MLLTVMIFLKFWVLHKTHKHTVNKLQFFKCQSKWYIL